jgi:hypothetical protein
VASYLRVTGESSLDLPVNDDVDFHSTLGSSLEHVVKTILLVQGWRTAQIQLGAQPPIQNQDLLLGS